MTDHNVIFTDDGEAVDPKVISDAVTAFPKGYANAVREIISNTDRPDLDKDLFMKNCATVLVSFKMTRAGPFKGIGGDEAADKGGNSKKKLVDAWSRVGNDLISLRGLLSRADLKPRSRTLLLLVEASRRRVVGELWSIFKKLLPVTMSSSSYGLVGASKILFSLFPEVALPIDNVEWRKVFKTVDFGEVIHLMAEEISEWEKKRGIPLDSRDENGPTTLPAVYNVMAMEARGVKKR